MLTATTVTAVTFHDFVEKAAQEAEMPSSNEKIAAALGTSTNTVRDWAKGPPTIRWVFEVARVYKQPIPVVLVAAYGDEYGLTLGRLGAQVSADPDSLSNRQLLDALESRLMPDEEPGRPRPPYSERRTKEWQQERRSARKK